MEWLDPKGIVHQSDVLALERSFGIKLPAEYAALQLRSHGARPRKNRFDTERRTAAAIKSFLPITRESYGNVYDVTSWLAARLPSGMIPIASDPGGNYICLSYQYVGEEPAVVFWNHEQLFAYEFVSGSFREFMQGLY